MKSYVLRINSSLSETLISNKNENRISIGWCDAKGLLNAELNWYGFREVLHRVYYADRKTYRAAGNAGASLWNFIRNMKKDDYVLIPSNNFDFYIAKIISDDLDYLEEKISEETAFSRKATWLNNGQPIKRNQARSKIISRLKVYQTCVDCSDLNNEILELLEDIASNRTSNFEDDLRKDVTKTILNALHTGKIENFGFERLLKNLFIKLGSRETKIVPRSKDKGSDLIVEFYIFDIVPVQISVQAKHWNESNPVKREEIEQLKTGIESDGTNYGLFITSGIYAQEAMDYVEQLYTEGIIIHLIDGLQLSSLLFKESVFDLT
ncbi:restriction endonuclease [Leptospira interrogans]|uniref:restriction endonuclease n=1 Tax=Leptospira interrogans TaxID=173 RepID=UPI0002BBF93E|nr:restriction endonuclease [Leptospira interrogans]